MLLADSDLGKTNWVSIARSLVSLYNINISDNASMIKTKVFNYFQSLVINNLRHHILEDKKLKTYASFKSKFKTYLDIFSDFNMRCCFAKLRLSAHNLHIETGRYSNRNIPREERYCLFCKTKNDLVIEDEIHFLTCCPLFATEREEMINSISEKYPSIKMLNMEKLLIWLLSQEDPACLELVGNFCKNSFKKREKEIKIINRA